MSVKPLLAAFLLLPSLAAAAGTGDACAELSPDSPVVRLSGVDEAGDPVLADGRRLRLVGLAPRQDDAEAQRFEAGLRRRQGQDFAIVLLGEADRWGRFPARLFESGAVPARGLAEALIAEGAATALPEARPARCTPTPPIVAGAARRRQALTAAPPPAVPSLSPGEVALDSHDLAALRAHEGRLVLLTGRVASVAERAQRTYVNFSRRRGEAASIVLSKTLWRELKDAGWTASGLGGKRLRARGVLSGRDGLLLDVTSSLALELID
ncbi:hypothetical protein ABIE41_001051 [Bosea sp. OAE506]|uniref:hypothetical protein n=1 Tax=Bosea sp. OAE506 TaxID=2663870 RepID=UPI001789C302